MGSGALDGQRQHLHDRKCSLALLAREPEAVHISKAGFLWKRGKVKRNWLRRWCVVRKGVFRYCSEPGQASSFQERVLSGRVIAARRLAQPIQRSPGALLHGFMVEDDTKRRKLFFCETERERDAWCWYFQNHATRKVFVGDLYTVDWKNMLGSGYFAAVVRAWDRASGTQVALKIMARSVFRDHLALLGREVAVMHAMGSHAHLLPLQQVMYAEQRMYLVTEYMDGGELAARVSAVRPLSEFAASRIMRQVLSALAHLHARRICHTDIKPENILFTSRAPDAPIKLIDFSLAVFFRQPAEPCGTPEFMAPELIASPDEVAKSGWGGEVDMWAVGILLFWMLSGHTPFQADSISAIFVNIELGRWSFAGECWQGVSEAAKGLIRSLLRRNPHHRPSAKSLLRHPWIIHCALHQRQPSLNLHSRGIHTLPEAQAESEAMARRSRTIQPGSFNASRLPIADIPQLLISPAERTPEEAGPRQGTGTLPSAQPWLQLHSTRSAAAASEESCEDAVITLDIPDSPAWSTCTESPITPRRQWEYEATEDGGTFDKRIDIQDSAECLDRQRSHAKAMSIQIHPSCDLGDNADTPNSRRHQVIDFADLHKLRGITDLRRAIIAAERNNSLPSLVDEARKDLNMESTIQAHGSRKSSLVSAVSLSHRRNKSIGAARH